MRAPRLHVAFLPRLFGGGEAHHLPGPHDCVRVLLHLENRVGDVRRALDDRLACVTITSRRTVGCCAGCRDGTRRENGCHQAAQTILNPTLYAYVSGGTLCRYAHRSIATSSFTHEPPRTIRMLPDSGPHG